MDPKQHEKIAVNVSTVTIVINLALAGFKFLAGFVAHSGAMVSDAVHSASDVLATFIVILGVKLAGRDADRDHPYGHERLECVAALILGVILAATGLGIGMSGIRKITGGEELLIPGTLALIAAVVSIVVKEAMFWYTWLAAKKIDSSALKAEAWHHRSDALSSVGSFAGILGARLGFPALDPVASVVICLFILKAAWDIMADALGKMTDHACPPAMVQEMADSILSQPGVLGLDTLNTRLFGDRVYVDVEIQADGDLPLKVTHATAQAVHDTLEQTFPQVKHCMVHVNPAEKPA
ncbi:cation diffusion facilitator family transporter [Oscillibacter sp.]|uniref:cation diffusion facilitator family transporter n=1 Tax=Oscillibacter sp. TaxID=1945593 RepID=UPI001B454CE4|nr:cation diffusion facilitator family transporter [Oscillibacter sp.]MBP3510377.1 cation transporter [Oscillibacter sp.]